MGRSKNKRITKKIRYLTVRNTPQPHGRRVEFGRKTASRRFLPYFPLWQSMTYRLPGQPIIAQVHPVPRRHRRSTPTKLDVGPSPGQDSKRRKKKKKDNGGSHYKNRPYFVWMAHHSTFCLQTTKLQNYQVTTTKVIALHSFSLQHTTTTTMPSVGNTSQFPPCPGPPPKGPLPPLPK